MKNKQGIITAVICFAVFFIGTYAQYQLSPMAMEIMSTLNIDETQYSLLFTFCMFPALVLSIVSGMLCDKFGIKATVAVAVGLSTLGIVVRIFAPNYTSMLLCMLVLGLGCMFLTATSAKILAPHFTGEKLGSMMGFVNAGSTVAMFVALATTAWFPSVKAAFTFAAVLSVLVFLSWIFLVKQPKAENAGAAPSASMMESLKVCLSNRYIWISGLTLMFLMTPQVIVSSFLPQALQIEKGMDSVTAGYMTSVYMLGAIAGSIFGPQIFAKCKSGRVFLTACSAITAVGVALGWNIPNPILLAAVMFLCGAGISTYVPLLYSLPISLPGIGPAYAGTAGGLSATIQILGATVVPTYVLTPLFGSNFNSLFLAAGCVAALSLITANLLPMYGKK